MIDSRSLAFQVNEILSKYIFIHDEIFKFSIRKIIPIPGIFKKIDYLTHCNNLDVISKKLDAIEKEITNTQKNIADKTDQLFLVALDNYASSLNKTIKKLYSISYSLYKKSEGEDYSASKYNNDMNIYNQYVEQYRIIGSKLNSLL